MSLRLLFNLVFFLSFCHSTTEIDCYVCFAKDKCLHVTKENCEPGSSCVTVNYVKLGENYVTKSCMKDTLPPECQVYMESQCDVCDYDLCNATRSSIANVGLIILIITRLVFW